MLSYHSSSLGSHPEISQNSENGRLIKKSECSLFVPRDLYEMTKKARSMEPADSENSLDPLRMKSLSSKVRNFI